MYSTRLSSAKERLKESFRFSITVENSRKSKNFSSVGNGYEQDKDEDERARLLMWTLLASVL